MFRLHSALIIFGVIVPSLTYIIVLVSGVVQARLDLVKFT